MTALLEEGLVLMVIGMGVVFVLLTLLVFVVQAVSKLSHTLAPAAPTAAAAPPGQPVTADEEVVSVISAAIRMSRRRRNDKP